MKTYMCTLLTLAGAALLLGGCAAKKKLPEGAVEGFLLENASKYVDLGDYTGLELERFVYEITDEDVDMEIESRLMQNVDYQETDGPAAEGDLVDLDISITVDGQDFMKEEDYALETGYAMLGFELDDAVIGSKAGDHISFSQKYDDNATYEEWANHTVSFDADVLRVTRQVYPEITDAFLKELGYDSEEAWREDVRAELIELNDRQTQDSLFEEAFDQLIHTSTFREAPSDFSGACSEMVRTNYSLTAESMGVTLEELYDFYGLTEQDVQDEIDLEVNRRVLISAMCEKEGLYLTEDEYRQYAESRCEDYGFDSVEAMEEGMTKDVVTWNAYAWKVGTYLIDNAVITDVSGDYSEDMDIIDDPDWEADEVMEGLEDADVIMPDDEADVIMVDEDGNIILPDDVELET